jgi:3-dehydroquinate dehydratase / shikimate dehydrogenase
MADIDPRVCVSICERDWASFERSTYAALEYGGWIEFRLDCLTPDALADLGPIDRLLAARERTIVTLRSPEEGGKTQITEDERLNFWLNQGLKLPTTYVDLELRIAARLLERKVELDWTRVICSYHNQLGIPANLNEVFENLLATPARILKIAVTADDAPANLKVFQLIDQARQRGREMIAIAMGEAGVVSRILGPSRGSFLTYASLTPDSSTAAGQLTIDEMKNVYRLDHISKDTFITGVVGRPIAHSISPQIHNAAFHAARMDAVYVPFDVRDLEAFFKRIIHPRTREIEWPMRGLSITAPHKTTAIDHIDGIDPVARQIGAINTVVIEQDRLCGYNTDADAFLLPLKKRMPSLNDVRVALIGAGGVASAALFSLQQERAEVVILARDLQKAKRLADHWPVEYRNLQNASLAEFDVVINATPLGTIGALERETPVSAEQLRGARLVYDLVYNPMVTRFLREGRAAGCETLDGLEMFLAQAVRQFELWTGQAPNYEVMRAAATKALTGG